MSAPDQASAESPDQSPPNSPGSNTANNAPATKGKLSLGSAVAMTSSLKNLGKAAAQRLLAKQGATDLVKEKEKRKSSAFCSDCDSEGNDPPTGFVYVDPATIDDSTVPPPRSNDPIKLPFFKPRERPRLREKYASKISYEDWVDENAEDVGADRDTGRSRVTVEKLEEDSDFPVGRFYFWKAFCPPCSKKYDPYVPGSWACVICKEKTWQQASDPESRRCAVCKLEVAAMITVGNKRVRNPMSLNAHVCKRCGRVVCDNCYAPAKQNLEEWGYNEPQNVCTRCINDMVNLRRVPEDEDLGTLHDEIEGTVDDETQHHPFWAPKCTSCNVTFNQPPLQWLCTRCAKPVWQPREAPESKQCWICSARDPKVRCHKCGQLACNACGAFGQPLPELGFLNGEFLTVCRVCYGGISQRKTLGMTGDEKLFSANNDEAYNWPAKCSDCGKPQAGIPSQWKSTCHSRAAWEVCGKDHTTCSVCAHPVQDDTSDNCRRCGRLCCQKCTQYREPVTDRGFEKGKMLPVCRGCFGQHHLFEIDPTDLEYWPPRCVHCKKNFPKAPDRWRCPNQCGNLVWQPLEHIMSKCCWACGKSVSSAIVNCRKCGRIVCRDCGQGRAEIVERGFTKGVEYPICNVCKPPKTKESLDAERKKKEDEEKAAKDKEKAEKEKKAAAAAAVAARGSPGKRAMSPGAKEAPGKAPAGKPGGKGSSPIPGGKSSPVPGGKGSPTPGGKGGVSPKRPMPKPPAKQQKGAVFKD